MTYFPSYYYYRRRCRCRLWSEKMVLSTTSLIKKSKFYYGVLLFLLILSSFPTQTTALDEIVCGGFDMRNSPSTFLGQLYKDHGEAWVEAWKNCTVIEGDVSYNLMQDGDTLTPDDFKEVTLPYVREITGSLMIFQVAGLESVSTLLPNLRVIGGNSLFQHYALVLFQNPNLKEIGLSKLTEISKGGVRVSANSALCFASTINFTDILRDKTEHIVVEANQDLNSCGDQCKQNSLACSSRRSRLSDSSLPNCWSYESCQLVCPSLCTSQNRSCNFDTSPPTCCHEECAGGCNGPSQRDCFACRHVNVGGQCLKSCPDGLYKLKGRRCITAQACRNRMPVKDQLDDDAYWKPLPDGTCQTKCPSNYNVDPGDKHRCVPCANNKCVKKCKGGTISSLADAEHQKGCTIVVGNLEISIQSDVTKNLAQKLEQSLGEIREINGYLKISFSPSLLSLSMFKNLRAIRGIRKKSENANKYALSVFENQNLAQLWNFSNGLTVNGSIQFHYNPRLCYSKIKELAAAIGLKEIDPRDVSEFTNGNKAVCEVVEMVLRFSPVPYPELEANMVMLAWDEFMPHLMDHRMFLGYQLYSRKVESENVDIFEGRDACRDSWQMTFVEPMHRGAVLTDLRPNTLYAFYLTTLIVNSPGAKGGMSKVVYRRTKFSAPSQPRVTKVESHSPTSITIEWEPPLNPNGDVTHYMISYVKRRDTLPNERDYCRHKPIFVNDIDDNQNQHFYESALPPSSQSVATNALGKMSLEQQCCNCDSTDSNYSGTSIPDVKGELEKAAFENAIQNKLLSDDSNNRWRKKRSVTMQNFDLHHNRSIPINEIDTLIQHIMQPVVINVTGFNFTLTNLSHFTSYEIKIFACQNVSAPENFCSSQEVLKNKRTQLIVWKDEVNGTSIRLANASEPGSHSISIQWDQPEDPNGLVLGYEIQFAKIGASGDATNQCIPIAAYLKQNGYTFTDLAFGRYRVRVRCMSLAQWGEWSTYYDFDILEPYKFPNAFLILIAVGCSVFVIVVVAFFAVYVYKRNFRKKLPEYLMNVFSANPEYISQLEVYKPDEWELKRESIALLHEIGRGTFGNVFAGMGSNSTSVCGAMFGECAVKTVSERASIYDRWHFLIEASVMKQFNVAHIVKLYGVVSEGQPALVVMEMMHKGNLRDYLRSRRPNAEENIEGLSPPSMKETMQWAGEIADGMAYLEALKFCHRDLAARNCMVSAGGVCKIGDFGMARDVYVKDYYRPTGKRLMPVRWMAPEALKDATFTSKSDVWSYGVVLWEIATLASQPYLGLSNEEVMRYVVDHRRVMEMPRGCPTRLYDLMCLCWKYERKDRITFADVVALILPDLNQRFRQVSYYCTQRHLKETTSRSSTHAKNRHSSLDEPLSEVALITPEVESIDDRCFETTPVEEKSVLEGPFCHNNRVSPARERTLRKASNNFEAYPSLSNTLLSTELVNLDTDVLHKTTGVDQRLNKNLLLNGCAAITT